MSRCQSFDRALHSRRFSVFGWVLVLAAASFALSFVTAASRAKLWLGPQTLVLGLVGGAFAVAVALLARMWAESAAAASLDRPSLNTKRLVWVLAAGFLASSAILLIAFQGFPNSADEYAYLFTGRTLSDGQIWKPSPADPLLFQQQFLIAKSGRWVSQYLPGWPAVIAAFYATGLPPWLAAPACGAGLLALLWLCLRIECRAPSLCTMLLLAYATTSFFLLNGATYFSHNASAAAVVGTILCLLLSERRTSWIWPAAAGACMGYAFLCRIDSGALAAVAAMAAWIGQGFRLRILLLGLAGAAPMLALGGIYDWAITGVPFQPPTVWAGYVKFGAGGVQGVEAHSSLRPLVQTIWRMGELADTASLLILALYCVALTARVGKRQVRFYDWVPVANFIIFLVYPDLGGFQMGPRYWFDGYAVMHLTIAGYFGDQSVQWRRFVTACCVLLVPVSLARLPEQVAFHAREMQERSAMYRLAASLPATQRAVVLVPDFPSAWNERANRTSWNLAKDFVRNGDRLDRRILFARGDIPDAADRACREYPEALIVRFWLDQAFPSGVLQPVECP